jgi:hypothetical protein
VVSQALPAATAWAVAG